MTDRERLLGAEIDRILKSPYPTQLKASNRGHVSGHEGMTNRLQSLRDILYDAITEEAIDITLQSRICQLDYLAECLLEGLEAWPYVLDIVISLSSNIAFRDALLRREPSLLLDLLDRATQGGALDAKYSKPAVALLAHPLPDDLPLPASAQVLFLHLVQYATQNPCASALKPVYVLLRGTSSLLVGLLSKETLSRLEEQLGDILRSNHVHSAFEAGDQLRTLHCLSIMQMITEAYSERHSLSASVYGTQDLLASTPTPTPTWTPENMQNFFVGTSKAPKTVQLVVLQAMWACQAHDEAFYDRMTTLSLGNHIIAAIPSDVRDAWCGTNAAVVQKLQQKVLACQDGQLKLAAMAFVCRLCKPVMLQSSLVETVRHTTTNLDLLYQLKGAHQEDALSCFLPLLDRETIELLLRRMLDGLSEAPGTTPHTTFQTIRASVHALVRLHRENTVVEDASSDFFLHGLIQSRLEELLAKCSKSITVRASQQTSQTCTRSLCVSHDEACRELVGFLLTMSVYVPKEENHSIRPIITLLVSLHSYAAQGSMPCHHVRNQTAPKRISPAAAVSLDSQDVGHQDWRLALRAYGDFNAQKTVHDVTKLFAQACSDLEARCENVEQPLTEERSAREVLEEELEALQQAYDDLEAQHLDLRLHQDGLEAENDQSRRTLEAAQDENAQLAGKISNLQRDLEDIQDDFKSRLAVISAAREAAELERATISAKMQEQAEDMQDRAAEYSSKLDAQSRELDQLRKNTADITASREELFAQVGYLQRTLNDKNAALEAINTAHNEAEVQHAQLSSDLATALADLEEARASHEREVGAMREVVRQNSEAANASHNHALDRMASQHGGEVAGLEEQIAQGVQQIKKLEKKCRQKDAQIAEANALRVQLLATLGGGGAHAHLVPPDTQSQIQSQTQMSLPHRTRSSARPIVSPTHLDDSVLPFSQSFDCAMDNRDSQIFDGEPAAMQTSFSSTSDSPTSAHNAGPTPKRARPRRSIKASIPSKTVRTSKAAGNVRVPGQNVGSAMQASTKRRPLGGLHVNVSPRKEVGGEHGTPSKSSMRLETQDFEDTMLD